MAKELNCNQCGSKMVAIDPSPSSYPCGYCDIADCPNFHLLQVSK